MTIVKLFSTESMEVSLKYYLCAVVIHTGEQIMIQTDLRYTVALFTRPKAMLMTGKLRAKHSIIYGNLLRQPFPVKMHKGIIISFL